MRSLPTWGSLAISHSFLCFWRKGILTADVKLRIPLTDIDSVGPSKAWGFRIVGLAVQVRPQVHAPSLPLFQTNAVPDLIRSTELPTSDSTFTQPNSAMRSFPSSRRLSSSPKPPRSPSRLLRSAPPRVAPSSTRSPPPRLPVPTHPSSPSSPRAPTSSAPSERASRGRAVALLSWDRVWRRTSPCLPGSRCRRCPA